MLGVLRRLLLGAFGVVIAALCVVGLSAPASAEEEGTIHALANESRASAGLAPLALNGSLSQVALGWAQQMAASGTLSHNPSYSAQIPAGWRAAAENVAQGYGSGAAVHAGWMNSAGHRANILGDFTDIGIAHITAGGTTWSVQVFAKYATSSAAARTPAPAPVPAPVPIETTVASQPDAPGAPAVAADAPSAADPAVEDPTVEDPAAEDPAVAELRGDGTAASAQERWTARADEAVERSTATASGGAVTSIAAASAVLLAGIAAVSLFTRWRAARR